MNNVSKLRLNALSGLIKQLVVVIAGLILPRYILLYFGSEINGLTNSIKQFLSIIGFLELGLGAVVQSALYRPIAKKDYSQINMILASARSFFQNLARFLLIYVVGLMAVYPLVIDTPLSHVGTAFLIFAMSISLFAQYYFGIVNQLFLNSDQRNYIHIMAHIITQILNTVVSILLIVNGASIQIVQLVAGLIFLLRPLFLKYYVDKNYKIDYKVRAESDAIPQKWNGVAQHIAYTVTNSTDTVVLSLFSSLSAVSVYSVHNLVVNGVKLLVTSSVGGIQSFFGNLIANDESEKLNNYFSNLEWLIHTLVTFVFGMTAVLINSFVLIYTKGIGDANYDVPLFALLITLAQAVYCLRLPYNAMVFAGGHYKQTQLSSVIEATINVGVSLIAVNLIGLVGVALGTLFAMIYRTIYLVYYLSENIVNRPPVYFFKHVMVDAISFILIFIIGRIMNISPANYGEWFISALTVGVIFSVIVFVVNLIFYKDMVNKYLSRIKNRFSK